MNVSEIFKKIIAQNNKITSKKFVDKDSEYDQIQTSN
jgi:hypothetical protein